MVGQEVEMRTRGKTTETLTATAVRAHWSDVVNKVAQNETRVVVEKNGAPVAVIISARDYEWLQQLDKQRAERMHAALMAFSEPFKDVPVDELEREVAKAIAEVRAENRQRSAKTA
jgi:prevent-host-death family protein